METHEIDSSAIKGWGIDADPKNEPTYPMKHYTGDDHQRFSWTRPPLQPATVEILHSIERPNLTAVFGTVAPPSGLSGVIRRAAFKYSENLYKHWLPLLLADRINVVEGMIDDIIHLKMPRPFAERGYGALWKYRKDIFFARIGARLVAAGAIAAYFIFRKKKNKFSIKRLLHA